MATKKYNEYTEEAKLFNAAANKALRKTPMDRTKRVWTTKTMQEDLVKANLVSVGSRSNCLWAIRNSQWEKVPAAILARIAKAYKLPMSHFATPAQKTAPKVKPAQPKKSTIQPDQVLADWLKQYQASLGRDWKNRPRLVVQQSSLKQLKRAAARELHPDRHPHQAEVYALFNSACMNTPN